MTAPAVVLQRQGAIARIVLNRPQARNELDPKGALALRDACQTAIEDDEVTVVVLTGAGQVFCADDGTPPSGGPETLERLRVADALASMPKPAIAALNGDAMGHGLELALACDLRIAAEDARLGLGHVSRGAIPWDGGTQRLPRLVGRGLALEMVLTGRALTATEAQRAGLVTKAVPRAAFETEVQALAEKLAAAAPIAARYAKEAVRDGMDLPLAHGLRLEADLAILLHTSADRAEGIGSFLKKQTPRFTGR